MRLTEAAYTDRVMVPILRAHLADCRSGVELSGAALDVLAQFSV